VDEVARALLDRIAASPGDGDADHLVLADHLMQHGDPGWGELISLACAEAHGTLTRGQRHRLFLLRGDLRWLGPIKAVTFHRRLERGLLVATGVDARRRGMIEASFGQLAWRTVREVTLHERARWAGHFCPHDELAALLRQLAALTSLHGVTSDVVRALAAGPPLALRELGLFLYRHSAEPMYGEVHEVLGGPVFDSVRELILGNGLYRERNADPAELDWWLGAAPITRHVEVLNVGHLPELELWRQALARSARPALRALRAHNLAMYFKLERDAGGRWSRLTARCRDRPGSTSPLRLDQLERALAPLAPESLTSLEVQVVPTLQPEAERRIARIAARQPGAALAVTSATADESP
jgi:uncharacterized protein (TIGR02996 family)